MTDTRLPSEWLLSPLVRMKATAFRSYVCALMWSVANRTDGVIKPEDLAYIPGFDPGDMRELMATGAWKQRKGPFGEWWQIADFKRTQTSRAEHEVLENARRREREKKQRQRAKAAEDDAAPQDAVPGDSAGGQSPGIAQAGRQAGKNSLEEWGTAPARVDPPDEDDEAEYAAWVDENDPNEDWCSPEERAHYDALTDRTIRDGYDR